MCRRALGGPSKVERKMRGGQGGLVYWLDSMKAMILFEQDLSRWVLENDSLDSFRVLRHKQWEMSSLH